MKKLWSKYVLISILILLFAPALAFGVPQLINYQGMLTDNAGTPVDGSVDIVFSIYSVPSGGSALWTETQASVAITNGVFNVLMGSATPIAASVFESADLYLGVKIGADPEMTPRQQLVTVPFAFNAAQAANVADGAISPEKLADTCSPGQSLVKTSTGWECRAVQCNLGDMVRCYEGSANTKDVGPCTPGWRICTPAGTYGACSGQVVPQPETCGSAVDLNCDGEVFEPCTDGDGDGFNPPEDCNDGDDTIYPGAIDICGDAIDQDCNGTDLSCDSAGLLENCLGLIAANDIMNAKTTCNDAATAYGSDTSNDADASRFFAAWTNLVALYHDMPSDGNPSNGLNTFGDVLDAIGCATDSPSREPSTFDSSASCPSEMPDTYPTTGEFMTFATTVVQPVLEDALQKLNTVSGSFEKLWTEPMDGAVVESDYGDVLALKASIKGTLATLIMVNSYNHDVDPYNSQDLSVEQVLNTYPTLANLTSATELPTAENYSTESADDTTAAIDWMNSEVDSQGNDYIALDASQSEVNEAKSGINDYKTSLTGPSVLDHFTADLSPLFAGQHLRLFVPTFVGNTPGFFPDPTFNSMWTGYAAGLDHDPNADYNGDGIPDMIEEFSPFTKNYQVWGGSSYLSGDQGFNPGYYGYAFLGESDVTDLFNGTYTYYIIMTGRNSEAFIDTVGGDTGQYYGTSTTGNTWIWWNIGGAPDGLAAYVGFGNNRGYILIDPFDSPASIMVYVQ